MRISTFVPAVLSFAVVASPLLAEQQPVDPAAAMAQAMQMLNQGATAGKNALSIDAKAMKALLPAKDAFADFKRTKAGSESTAAMGMRISTATAEFKKLEGEGSFTVKFEDIGGLGAFAKAALQSQEIDEETETGFHRTGKFGTYKTEEEYDTENKQGSIKLFPGDRVAVEITGEGVSFETLQAVLAKIDVAQLAALKPVAPAADAQ
jgi:hypothetical protein